VRSLLLCRTTADATSDPSTADPSAADTSAADTSPNARAADTQADTCSSHAGPAHVLQCRAGHSPLLLPSGLQVSMSGGMHGVYQ
jgi:hypothetical protein